MPRLAPLVAGILAASVLVACALRNDAVMPQPSVDRPATSMRSVAPDVSRVVSLHGVVDAPKSSRFVLHTRKENVRVDLSSHTVVRGRLRAGEYAQVVGRGVRPDRARYVALWNGAPPKVSLTGRIVASNDLGFSVDRTGSSSATLVVLSSATKAPAALVTGQEVIVDGFGSAARGIVATRVSLDPASPSPSPTASGAPTSEPTATPTPTPTPAPTPTPTPMPTLTPGPPPRGISLYDGAVVGADDMFTPPDSDSANGGQGQMVDGIPCAPNMSENAYHVHVYLGLYVNGKQVAIPDQIGMYRPGQISNGYTNTATCFYYIHTHDASGKIHIESPSTAPRSSSLYALQNVFDVWGMKVGSTGVGPFQGPLRVFIGHAQFGKSMVYPSSYSEYFGDPNAIALTSHEAIWLEVGAPYHEASNLPEINFENEF